MQIRYDHVSTRNVGFRFPAVRGVNLEGRNFSLPEDLDGRAQLLVVAFQRWHQDLVDSWMPAARRLERMHPGLQVYEVPTLREMNPFSRFFIDSGMRSGIPDANVRAHTMTLYLDKTDFRSRLGIPDEHDIHLFLLDGAGNVVWRGEGSHHEATESDLRDAVARLLPRAD